MAVTGFVGIIQRDCCASTRLIRQSEARNDTSVQGGTGCTALVSIICKAVVNE
jgi:hypothetical protein